MIHVDIETDIAIVGAGCAGAYMASRIKTDPKLGGRRFEVFEADWRIGGRLLSAKIPDIETFRAELGAMRVPESHLLAMNLLREMYKHEQGEIVGFSTCDGLWFLRGRRLRELSDQDMYKTIRGETGKAPVDLIIDVVKITLGLTSFRTSSSAERKLQRSTSQKIQEWLEGEGRQPLKLNSVEWGFFKQRAVLKDVGQAQGKLLRDIGLWNLLYRYLSPEAYLLVHDALGYESIVSNWNAAEAIPWFLADFAEPRFVTLKGGLEGLVRRLFGHAYFGRPRGEDILINHVLLELEPGTNSDPRFKLVFGVMSLDGRELQRRTVRAKEVVLALPRQAIERIALFGDDSWDWRFSVASPRLDVRRAIGSVSGHALFKLFIVYDEPWWVTPLSARRELARMSEERRGVRGWRALTDLPLRQVYHFEAMDIDGRNRGIVMASYSDEHYVDFWRPLGQRVAHASPEASGRICCSIRPNTDEERDYIELFAARRDLVAKAERQLKSIHGSGVSVGRNRVAYCKDWGDEYTYAGWHTWKPGVDAVQTSALMANPCKGLYICGEAYSTQQGWIEGVLKSTELALKAMGASAPVWAQMTHQELLDYASS